jgi:hypothetical protein
MTSDEFADHPSPAGATRPDKSVSRVYVLKGYTYRGSCLL